MGRRHLTEEPHLLCGVCAGIVGGLAASWVMNQFLAGVSKATEMVKEQQGNQQPQKEEQEEDSTVKVADAVASSVTGEHLSQEQKTIGGPIVHYAFGGLMGGVYGGVAEYFPASRAGFGTLFGSGLFAGADLVAVPALGLSKLPTEQPATDHASHWAAHIVYGATVELVRRGVRQIF